LGNRNGTNNLQILHPGSCGFLAGRLQHASAVERQRSLSRQRLRGRRRILDAGDLARAESLYRLAGRWGTRDAAEVSRQLDKRVPPADLLLANLKRTHGGHGQTGSPVRRPDPNERLSRMLDEAAPVEYGN
jgi:hypothetical protein